MNRQIIDPLVDKSTELLDAWTEQRGAFKERVFRKYDFAELIVHECMKLANAHGYPDFARILQSHFEVNIYD